jgi:hypothetical protein
VFESPRAHHIPMYFVYVLENTVTQRRCTGFTSDLVHRLGQHNSGVTNSSLYAGQLPDNRAISDPFLQIHETTGPVPRFVGN